MKHADMHPNTKTRVDAGATLGRKLQEVENAIRMNVVGHASDAYVDVKRAEYKHALDELIREAQLEGRAAAAAADVQREAIELTQSILKPN